MTHPRQQLATKGLSLDEIRGKFFGAQGNSSRNLIDSFETSGLKSYSDELSPSAKYVVREAKKRLGQQSAFTDLKMPGQIPGEEDLFRLIRLVEDAEGEELSDKERTSAVAALSSSLEHYDILTPLLENPLVNDIIVRSYKDISIQSGRQNIQTDLRFVDHEAYKSFIENLLKRAGKSCTVATPVVDAAIDPHVRACVTHESFSPPGSGPMLTLRVARHSNISIEGLVQSELAPRVILDYLSALIKDGDKTILIGGEVGTGKTTLVRALASKMREHEAILVIEDTHEIVLDRRFVRTLLTREPNTEGAGKIAPAQAIRTGMRMAMNRVILGEMRDAEAAEAFIDVCASGHAGMSTIHARNARDAISRLELFLARAQEGVGIENLRRQIANALSVVVFLGFDHNTKKRRIIEVLEVGASSDGAVQLSPIFSYAPTGMLPEWKREAGLTLFPDSLRSYGITFPAPGERLSFDPEELYRRYQEQSSTA